MERVSGGGRSRAAKASTQGAAAGAGFVGGTAEPLSRRHRAGSVARQTGADRACERDAGAAVLLASRGKTDSRGARAAPASKHLQILPAHVDSTEHRAP